MTSGNLSSTKKGLIIGIVIGLLFGFYNLISDCHIGLGSTTANPPGCENSIEFLLAGIETWTYVIISALFGFIINSLLYKGYGSIIIPLIQILSPIIVYGLLGLLIGWIVKKFRPSQPNYQSIKNK